MTDREPSPHRLLVAIGELGGGTGVHLAGLLASFPPTLWTVRVLPLGPGHQELPPHIDRVEYSDDGFLHRFPIAQWRQFRTLKQAASEFSPHVLHTFFFWPIVYGRILRGQGLIPHLIENREDMGFNWGRFEYEILRRTASFPDRVICVSEAVRQVVLHQENISQPQTVVIPNGVRPPARDDSRSPPAATKEALGFPSDALIVGMVANLNRAVKGVEYFVEAMPLIADQIPTARFLILGDGALRPSLQEQARNLGVEDRVVFAGYQPQVEPFYRLMDLSVLTSLSEGLSITLLESMSYGLPVVATQVGGNPELVEDGKTGLLVPPEDPERFAGAVIRLLRDPSLRKEMGSRSRIRVETEFSLTRVAQRYEEIYSSARDPER